jgi:hypothetical protein
MTKKEKYMDLAYEIMAVIEKARITDEYFNPHGLSALLDAINEYYGESYISDDIDKWVSNMWTR